MYRGHLVGISSCNLPPYCEDLAAASFTSLLGRLPMYQSTKSPNCRHSSNAHAGREVSKAICCVNGVCWWHGRRQEGILQEKS